MQCSDTSASMPAVKIAMPIDLAKDISYLMESVKQLGGNGRITLDMHGGNVTHTEVNVRQTRSKSA